MQFKSGVYFLILFSCAAQAEEMQRLTITSCAYQAGTAREIQNIRQSEGDDWSQFEQKVMKIYSDTQGRTDLLAIAKNVYLKSAELPSAQIHDIIFSDCVKRTQGNEPNA